MIYTMYTSNNNNYKDILSFMNYCVSCLKNSDKTESILSEILKIFKADEAVFLSPNGSYDGVNLASSFARCKDKSYLLKYADCFWRYDPLYYTQFCTTSDNLVFKTDDIIPYSQMVELDYYKSFLRPQNLLSELIIRLYSGGSTFGAISLQRYQGHSCFETKDVLKASLLVPYLVNIFEIADEIANINKERILLEQWMEFHSEGIILLDSEITPIYMNLKARHFCQLLKGIYEKSSFNVMNTETVLPRVIVQDCKKLPLQNEASIPLSNHNNRIVGIKNKTRYYLQYFPVVLSSAVQTVPYYVVLLSELTRYNRSTEEILTEQQKLSQREEDIARYVSLGLTNKQIAEKLFISPYTVQNHLKNIFQKTGLDSRTKLANLMKYPNNLSF